MPIWQRYIIKNVITAILFTLLVLLAIQTFINFIGELRDIGTLGYGLSAALLYVPLLIPSNAYQFLPIAGLLGCLMGLGRLAGRSELIVLRAAGVSIAQVMGAVAKAGLILLVVMLPIGEWLAPHAQNIAETRKSMAISGGQTLLTLQGTWVRNGDNFIHIAHVLPKNFLNDITRYQFSDHQLVLASHAQFGMFQKGQWVFLQVTETDFGQQQITSQYFPVQVWPITFNPRLLKINVINPAAQTLPSLWRAIHYLNTNQQSTNQLEFSLWQRLFQPLAMIILMLVGVPFVFGPLRDVTMGLRIFAGVILGFSFYTLNEFFGPIGMVYQFPPLLAAGAPLLFFLIFSGILIWRSR